MPESYGTLPEGLATVKLPSRIEARGAQFAAGELLPCFAASQLPIQKGAHDADFHLLAGLYAWAVQAGPDAPRYAEVSARLAAASFPFPAIQGAPPLPLATARAGGMLLCVLEGNVALATTQVIVNAANDQMQMGGGVAGALRSKGGIELELESRRHAPARLGDVVRTPAGKLAALELYHAVVIDYVYMNRTDMSDVESSYRKVLETALEGAVSSVTVPMLGCGVGGLNVSDVTATYLKAAREVGAKRKRGLLVLLVAYGDEDAARAAQALRDNADPAAAAREAEDFFKQAQKQLGYPDEG